MKKKAKLWESKTFYAEKMDLYHMLTINPFSRDFQGKLARPLLAYG